MSGVSGFVWFCFLLFRLPLCPFTSESWVSLRYGPYAHVSMSELLTGVKAQHGGTVF